MASSFYPLVFVLLGRTLLCAAQTCSVSDIQNLQPGLSLAAEKLDGHWFVVSVYNPGENTNYSSYTMDMVPTVKGLTTYRNINGSDNLECSYLDQELNSTQNPYVFSMDGDSPVTLIVAAAASDGQSALVYQCNAVVMGNQTCPQPRALLVTKRADPTATQTWLTETSNGTLPCFTNETATVHVQQTAECPLKPMWKIGARNCTVSSFTVQPSFDLEKYVAKPWKEVAWLAPSYLDPSTFYQDYVHTYTDLDNGTITVDIAARDPANNDCLFYSRTMSETNQAGELIFHDDTRDVPYNVMVVDYDVYAVVFGCYSVSQGTGECLEARGWVWSRTDTLSRSLHLQTNTLLQDLCVNPAALMTTPHNEECVEKTGGSSSLHSTVMMTIAAAICVTFTIV